MAGPRDAKSAFIRDNVLNVIDGRGYVWTYEPSITEDAAGDPIVAPADFAHAELSDNAVMVIDSGGSVWLYGLNDGLWAKGPNLNARVEGADKTSTDPWTRGANVTTRVAVEEEPPVDEVDPAPARSSRKKEKEEA